MAKLIEHVNRETDRNAWLEWRLNHIGSSDICTIAGLNPYQTPLELWAIKTGKMDDITETPAMKYGRMVEQAIIAIFADLHPEYAVEANSSTYAHDEYRFCTATPDAFLTTQDGAQGILECKHTALTKDWEEGSIPNYAHLQSQWQMGVMGLSFAHIGAVCAGRVNDFKDPKILFEPEIFDACLQRASEFLEAIKKDVPPNASAGDSRLLNDLLQVREEEIEIHDPTLCQMYKALEEKINQVKPQFDALEKDKKEIQNKIIQLTNGANVAKFPDGSLVKISKVSVAERMNKAYSYLKFNFKEGGKNV